MTKYRFIKLNVWGGCLLEIPADAIDVRTHMRISGKLQMVVTWLEEVPQEE